MKKTPLTLKQYCRLRTFCIFMLATWLVCTYLLVRLFTSLSVGAQLFYLVALCAVALPLTLLTLWVKQYGGRFVPTHHIYAHLLEYGGQTTMDEIYDKVGFDDNVISLTLDEMRQAARIIIEAYPQAGQTHVRLSKRGLKEARRVTIP